MRSVATEHLGEEPRKQLRLEDMPLVYYAVELVLREVAQALEEEGL